MAKPIYTDLKLTSEIAPKELIWGDQTIEVKQYLPIQEKLAFIGDVLNASADDNRFYAIGKVNMFFAITIISVYTNLIFSEEDKKDVTALYDEIIVSKFYDAVVNLIPEKEIKYLYDILMDTIEQIYKYQNSAYAIMDSISEDYNNLDFDVEKLSKALSEKENVQFLDKVLTKLG